MVAISGGEVGSRERRCILTAIFRTKYQVLPTYGTSPVKRQRRTKAEIRALRDAIYSVVEEMQPMTVRQVFYQLEVREAVPKSEEGYDAVQRQLLLMRREEVIPYSWIADNTRWQRKPSTFSNAEEALDYTARCYRRAIWENQDTYVEVWIEKDALAGIVYPETAQYDVPLMVSKGFSSDSYLYEAAQAIIDNGKPAFIYYFGDRDPSGVKVDPSIERGLNRLAPGADITFERIAVTLEQIEELNLPSRPTKRHKNSHAKGFVGDSVELDAMQPDELRRLVRRCIERHIDPRALEVTKVAEKSERELFSRMAAKLRNQNKGGQQ
jgi:hypothetical protein